MRTGPTMTGSFKLERISNIHNIYNNHNNAVDPRSMGGGGGFYHQQGLSQSALSALISPGLSTC